MIPSTVMHGRLSEKDLDSKERELIRLVRSVEYGEVSTVIKAGRIDRFEKRETLKPADSP